jgi:hypothetical protein
VTFFLINFWELMPITSPRVLSSGPLLLPGLMGASVLYPGASPGSVEAADGADDSFGNAEKHGITRIADGVFSLSHRGGLGERKMREALAGRLLPKQYQGRDRHTQFWLPVECHSAKSRAKLPRRVPMCVCGDDAGSGNKKPGSPFRELFKKTTAGFGRLTNSSSESSGRGPGTSVEPETLSTALVKVCGADGNST